MSKSDLENLAGDYLDHTVNTCLRHARKHGYVQREVRGPKTLIIHDRRDEIVNGEDLETLVVEEVERLIADMQADDSTDEGEDGTAVADGGVSNSESRGIRDTVAEALDIDPDDVESELRSDGVTDRMQKLNTAVTAIEFDSAVEQGQDYDEIRFIRNPFQYELTDHTVTLITT